ncbi:MAG: Hsp20/alpha crystallin family protein [Gammaproteobacteria bacterium]|nr:Hsp20/alpha crystallin family protein [Gammaproteobacteria bacterium]
MWAEACALVDEAEQLHRRFFQLLGAARSAPVWEPPANVFSGQRETWVTVALPGVAATDLRVRLSSTGLLVEAEISPPVPKERMRVLRLELPYGRLQKRIDLPAGEYLLAEQRLENGVLYVRLLKE